MFHIAGIFARGLFALAHGMSLVIPSPLGARDKRFIDNYWRFIEKFRITYFSGVPTTLATLAKQPPEDEDLRASEMIAGWCIVAAVVLAISATVWAWINPS